MLTSAAAVVSCSDATAPVQPVATTIVTDEDSLSFSALGQVAVVRATVLDQTGAAMPSADLAWSTASGLVADVTSDGIVTAVGNGTTTLTASSGPLSAAVAVSVAQIAASLALDPDSLVLMDPGDTGRMSVTARDSGGAPVEGAAVTWTSSDDGVASVDATGLVRAVATGTVVVTAEAGDANAMGTVRVEPPVTLVAAGPTDLAGEVATQLSLSVRVERLPDEGYGGTTVTWTTAAGSGSIVSGGTTVSDATGHAGAVWLLGTTAGAQQATASIESRGEVVEVTFSAAASPGPPVSASLVADSILLNGRGETAFLGPTYFDEFGNPTAPGGLTWESRDPTVASVLPDGLVTAGDEGSTWVVATLGTPTDSLLVTVSFRGAITITFDDGFLTAYTNAFPVFQEFDLAGNVAVNPAQVGFPAYMTEAHLDEVHAAGFSVVSHTMTHDTMTTRTAGELDWELRASQEWIEERGYDGSNVFVVPFHVWGARERDAIGQYYEAARGTPANAVSPDSLVSWRPSNPYDLTGIEGDDLPYTSVAGRDRLRALLQRTVDEGAFLDVFFHHLPPGNVADFRATLAVIDEFRDRVLPYHRLYPRFARSVF